MADTVTVLRDGDRNVVGNTATWTWIHGVTEDRLILETHGNIYAKNLEIYCTDPKFDTEYEVFKIDSHYRVRVDENGNIIKEPDEPLVPAIVYGKTEEDNNSKDGESTEETKDDNVIEAEIELPGRYKEYVIVTLIDRDPSEELPGGFDIIIRDINKYTTLATIRVEYNIMTTKDALTYKNFRYWVTNTNYGNGYTSLDKDQYMLFGFYNNDLSVMTETDIVDAYTLETEGVYNRLLTTYDERLMEIKDNGEPTYKDESGNRVVTYNPIFKPKGKGSGVIQRVPSLYNNNNIPVGTSSYFGYYNIPLIRSSNLPTEQVDIPWHKVATIEFTTYYPEIYNMYITDYPTLQQGQEGISMTVENQQWDIVQLEAYIKNRKFRIKILPIKQVTRGGLVTAQFHYHFAWDNGKYVTMVHRYDIIKGNNETAIDIDSDDIEVEDGEYVMRLYEGESKSYKVFTTAPSYKYTIDNATICTVNDNAKLITGLVSGTTYVTFKATLDGWSEGSVKLKVIVETIPTPKIIPNRRLVVVAVDETAAVSIETEGVRTLRYIYGKEGYCKVIELVEYNEKEIKYSGNINIKGIKEGSTTITVNGYWDANPSDKAKPSIMETIDVIVIPRGTYMLVATPNPLKISLRKDIEGALFMATTSAKYIGYEMPENPCFVDNANFGPIDENEKFNTEYTELWGYAKPLVRDKQYLRIFGHNGDGKEVVSLDVLVRVLDTVEVPKDEIWVSVEHKQEGYEDNEFENPDPRHFTIFKWLQRQDVDKDVYSHTIYLPTKSGTLATQELVDALNKEPKRYFEYANPANPTREINPVKKNALWFNTEDNSIWRCVDNEPNFNLWICSDGRQLGPAEKLLYPGPGMPGYGQGPMSIDLHPLYELEPLPGCYNPTSKQYGHYTDKYGNIYVYVPKFYTKLEGSQ